MDFSRVEFHTFDGVLLRGNYFGVEQQHAPIMILTQGLTLLKESYIDDTARRFQKAGIAALVYDHRGWGSSEGTPRQETNPLQQAEDYHDAVSFAATLAPAIDPQRIGIWGIGHSGGASMIAAASDPRIKVAVLNMPFTSGKLDIGGFPKGGLEDAWRDRAAQANDPSKATRYIPVWDDTAEQAEAPATATAWLHGTAAYEFITSGIARSGGGGTPWENKITLQSLLYISRVEPEDYIARITAPRSLLYLAAVTDVLTGPLENHKRVFARVAAENPRAEFVTLDDGHIENYFRNFEQAITVQLDYLKRRL